MKIAFTSCFDARSDKKQKVWKKVSIENPDVLLLLGDSIYMDFGFTLNRPRSWKQQKFANKMYKRYAKQWDVTNFSTLVQSVSHVGLTWDDHDFGWNNCYGVGAGKNAIPKNKRLISKGLFQQFKKKLQDNSSSKSYPSQPVLKELLKTKDKGIDQIIDIGQVRIIMLDGRTFREKANRKNKMLGVSQRKWLAKKINEWSGISIICTGSILTGGKESWDKYQDFNWLMAQNFKKTIVLSGDIHRNTIQTHESQPVIHEFTSSGAARKGFGGGRGNFGMLDVSGNVVTVTLFDREGEQLTRSITF